MKADPAAQRRLLELADADGTVARLAHQRSTAPELLAVAELTTALQAHRDDAVAADISAEDLEREQKRLDGEIAVLAMREEKDAALRDGGTMSGKALVEINHELVSLARRRGVLEDELLEVLEQQEAADAEAARCAALVTHAQEEIATAQTRADATLHDIDARLADAESVRDGLRGSVLDELLAAYDRQVSQGRRGAGLLTRARCGGCRMEFDRGTLASYQKAADDEVLRCDECGAILVRTHESGL